MTYSVQIPITSFIEIDIESSVSMSFSEIVSQINEVDLKEACLHLPVEDITKSFIRAVAKNNLKINAVPS